MVTLSILRVCSYRPVIETETWRGEAENNKKEKREKKDFPTAATQLLAKATKAEAKAKARAEAKAEEAEERIKEESPPPPTPTPTTPTTPAH